MKTATLEWLKAGELNLKTMEKLLDDEFLTCMVAFHAPDGALNPEFCSAYAFPVRVASSGPVSPAIKCYFFCSAKGGALQWKRIKYQLMNI
jgi:hypothetical protein